MLTSRTPKPKNFICEIVAKEVLALLRFQDVCYTILISWEINVLNRFFYFGLAIAVCKIYRQIEEMVSAIFELRFSDQEAGENRRWDF